ncbi:MAG: hypothetical protein EON57_06195 [Alphaproteobacteria bacterium]|nr:MAG: hypothetical protein EON57_06195 [Alphaproteobacteria bacterium]
MTSISKIVGGALAALLVTTTLAMAAGGTQQGTSNRVVQPGDTQIAIAIKKATCKVAGTPSEFPDDIWFTNKGNVVLKAGTKISWALSGYGAAKKHTLVADLAPGAGVYALGVNAGGIEAGHDCTAKVL